MNKRHQPPTPGALTGKLPWHSHQHHPPPPNSQQQQPHCGHKMASCSLCLARAQAPCATLLLAGGAFSAATAAQPDVLMAACQPNNHNATLCNSVCMKAGARTSCKQNPAYRCPQESPCELVAGLCTTGACILNLCCAAAAHASHTGASRQAGYCLSKPASPASQNPSSTRIVPSKICTSHTTWPGTSYCTHSGPQQLM